MIHTMNLHPKPFELIKSSKKIIEVRLNDEKRKIINIGDTIEFKKRPELIDNIFTQVVSIDIYPSFYELFESYPLDYFGYENLSIDDIVNSMYEYYSKVDEQTFGVVAIKIKR